VIAHGVPARLLDAVQAELWTVTSIVTTTAKK
jgi:hypothetical protein